MSETNVRVGVIGCGKISGAYFQNLTGQFEMAKATACADLDPARAESVASEYEGMRALSVEALFADEEIEIILNLTIPAAHCEIACRTLEAGKHTYGEKPLAVTRAEGRQILELAQAKGLRVGSAPDTVLGGGHMTARKVIDEGRIGAPVAVTAFCCGHGHESWHPAPEFYYKLGGGPLFDMGPYYLTAMINMMGPIRSVMAITATTFRTRTITSEPLKGGVIEVEVPTHVSASLLFESGAVGTLIMSFDMWKHTLPRIEVQGTEGALRVPDPNGFGGEVWLFRPEEGKEWQPVEAAYPYLKGTRGLGVVDMAYAIRSGRRHRCHGELAYHVLDVMHAIHDSWARGTRIDVESTCAPAPAFPEGLPAGVLDT